MNQQGEGKVTLGIVDNDQLTLAALSSILRSLPWLHILWTTISGDDAIDNCLSTRTRPQVILVDMSMENTSGAIVYRTLRRHSLPIGVVCMTSFSLGSYARAAAEAGAQALISKTDLRILSSAVRRASMGSATQCAADESARFTDVPDTASNLIPDFTKASDKRWMNGDRLSAREVEILRMYSEGLETEEIARSLSLSKFTIGTYVKRAVAKLHARNRIHAIIMCEKRGLL